MNDLVNRVARFKVSRHLMRTSPEEVADVFAQLRILPMRMEWLFTEDAVEYSALSPHFDPVAEAAEPPAVEIWTDRTPHGVKAWVKKCESRPGWRVEPDSVRFPLSARNVVTWTNDVVISVCDPSAHVILSVPNDCGCDVFDATGKQLTDCVWANVTTGEAVHNRRDANGRYVFGTGPDGMQEVLKERRRHPSPLTYKRWAK